MSKEKRIKYANKEFYRIKDIDTGKYYLARQIIWLDSLNPEDVRIMKDSTHSYIPKTWRDFVAEYKCYLTLDEVGHFYPTRKGAERMLSEFSQCSIHNRKTKAGRILNSKLNFVVVKSQMKVKDIEE